VTLDPSGPLVPAATSAHLHADATRELTAYRPLDPAQRRLQEEYLAHLTAHPNAMDKSGPPAHLTASCVVLDETGEEVLLTLHRKARRWFQFGGHYEVSDLDVHGAAMREAREESGIPTVTPIPGITQLDRHELFGDFQRCQVHLDIRFVAQVPRMVEPVVSGESLDVRWWPVASLPDGPDSEISALVSAGRRHLGLT